MKAFDALWSYIVMTLLNEITKTLPALSNYMLGNSRIVTFLKNSDFFLPGMKAHWEEREGRILLGDNSGGWAVM
jgi:hypothetical protein